MATQARHVDPRSEPRYHGLVENAVLTFRGAEHIVPVIDISTRGTQIESAIEPRLGESVLIRFEGCSPIYAAVKWVRGGRVGLGFGTELTIG